jgi:hypothetical protein
MGLEILKKHCEFNNPYNCYVLLAVTRKKDTPEITNSQEIVFREIIRHENDIVRKYNKLINQCTNYKDDNGKTFPFYIYVSVNARDSLKAFYLFQKRLIDWNEELSKDGNEAYKKIIRTDRHYISILASPKSKSSHTKYFLIDYDEKIKIKEFIELLQSKNITPVLVIETKNGYHIKVKLFNRQEHQFKEWNCEIKHDAQLFVRYVKNEIMASIND